jgi:threonine dehydrogenase-like Zn-dependent dehydrogenase
MNVISLEYHETLMAGSGMQAQEALAEAVDKYSGKYICVVEGSIPTRDKGVYMKLAGRPAMEVLADVGGKAAAIVTIGSCAAWGGIPSADPEIAFKQGVGMARKRGTCVLVGLPPGEFPVPLFDVVANCITIRGSFVGTRQDMAEALAFAVGGKVKADIELQPPFRCDATNQQDQSRLGPGGQRCGFVRCN